MIISTFLMLAAIFTVGFYLILGKKYSEVLFGIAVTSNAVNLLLIETSKDLAEGVDPLPQALILTAIVIGFALIAFFAAYIFGCEEEVGSDIIQDQEGS
ncbi:MAG: NADH-quinone oxidoreductase subunit K [Chlamydiota bacterium]|nr:NADH-quinone oxidoreductase subunit K [Chlamydiota bacterium]